MIKDIIIYPTPTGVEYAPDIRVFNEQLFIFIDDLKETVEANNLKGLAAPQVGSYYNLVVIKKDGEFLELINPRVLRKSGEITSVETTSYFPNTSVQIKRYESISLVYEDRNGDSHSLKASGDFSILLQRKIDYLFGANFLTKLKDKDRENFEASLNANGVSCPTTPSSFSRDYFIKASNIVLIAMLLLLISSFIISEKDTLKEMWNYQLYLSFGVLAINIFYALYSYYENKKFSICTNCYNMSIFGVVAMGFFRLTMIMVVSFLLIN
ncbi:peptide deformylase [Sulfurimonas sp.]|uniref:peptide deformylase n=1 Tax=Sulfurimonas sp. TaxID=2022749 RepID=UPI002B47E40F|nr:peptide deformylase [Sulfurimonas sp.]